MRRAQIVKSLALVSLLAASGVLCACGSYYRVKDPQTGQVFYTTRYDSDVFSGANAIKIKSATSGYTHVIEQPQIEEISKEEFEKATAGSDASFN